ncbi:hypothetical protein QM306_40690, partial [Burkholderia cenocepacia]|nr:hypothetical protein [Burkholderia cenocepacia]
SLPFSTGGGNTVYWSSTSVSPRVLNGKLGQATVERDGLRLTFRRAAGAAAPKRPQIDAPSYMWMEGGDMKMFNVLELNVRALIRNSAE